MARYGRVLPEYTLGKDNSVPDEQVARERFQRRKKQVEAYYKKMGYIENRFKQNFVDPPIFMLQAVIGVLRMPAVAIRDYKYNHDPQYKEKIDKQEDAEYKAEKERVKAIKDQLSAYIQEDLQKEASVLGQAEDKAPAVIAAKVEKKAVPPPPPVKAEEKIESPVAAKAGEKTEPLAVAKVEKKPAQKKAVKPQIAYKAPKAVIVARPVKGASPLKVQFYGSRSSSPNGRISAYAWDFGDGDTSTQKNPINTYWSATYGSRQFTATLTVTDNKGIAASTSTVIEVIAQ
ncbi:MAG: PKD domain-containing protein [Candidatus Omnitrophica bacterium]|nr:PKD domain-containing protein [Candidatus Omnitrophota bacterium]